MGKSGGSDRFYFLRFQITTDSECIHEIKRCLLLGGKTMTDLENILKNRHHFADKSLYSQNYGFPVVMYICESWTLKKADHQRIDAFELWCWRRLRVLWTTRRSNQSILKKISPEYSLEGLMLNLKLQYFGHVMRRANSLEKS